MKIIYITKRSLLRKTSFVRHTFLKSLRFLTVLTTSEDYLYNKTDKTPKLLICQAHFRSLTPYLERINNIKELIDTGKVHYRIIDGKLANITLHERLDNEDKITISKIY